MPNDYDKILKENFVIETCWPRSAFKKVSKTITGIIPASQTGNSCKKRNYSHAYSL
jgi:hypothetical protein